MGTKKQERERRRNQGQRQRLGQILPATRTVSIDLGISEPLTVTYNPTNAFSSMRDTNQKIKRETDTWKQVDILIQWLSSCLMSWDYFQDATSTEPIPISPESLESTLTIEGIGKIRQAIIDDLLSLRQ